MWVLNKIPIDIVEIVIVILKNLDLINILESMIEKLKRKDISHRIKDKCNIRCYSIPQSISSYRKPYYINNDSHVFYNNRINMQPYSISTLDRYYDKRDNSLLAICDDKYVIYRSDKIYRYTADGYLYIVSPFFYTCEQIIYRLTFID